MISFDFSPWQKLFEESAAGALWSDTPREHVTVDENNYFPIFRLVCSAFTGGSIAVTLRFGFKNADTDGSLDALTMGPLGAIGGQVGIPVDSAALRRITTVPPRVQITATSAALFDGAFTGTYSVHVAYLRQK